MIDQLLDALFKRADGYVAHIKADTDAQITTLLHRYICIVISSNIDQAIQAILAEYARTHGSSELKHFVEKRYERGTNYNTSKLTDTLSLFDPAWGQDFENQVLAANLKELLDSIYGLRVNVAHGGNANVSRPTLDGYLKAHKRIIAIIKAIVLD